MSGKKNTFGMLATALCLVILILDTKTALLGAQEGVTLCLKSIIPTLFPFCILSKYICSAFLGKPVAFVTPICRIAGMPKGSESILLLSFLGGYPLGAQCIDDAYIRGAITRGDAERMLAFCNNAGPAFLFGILGCLFPSSKPLWLLFVIHILSAILVGSIAPNKSGNCCHITPSKALTFTQSVEKSIKTICFVCCWIIIFRIVLVFVEKWTFNLLRPVEASIIAGILELANGCISLQNVECLGLRYILCALFLGLGGICIGLQTKAVAEHISTNTYFPGKLIQAGLSVCFASVTQHLLFIGNDIYPTTNAVLPGLLFVAIGTVLLRKRKIIVAFAS